MAGSDDLLITVEIEGESREVPYASVKLPQGHRLLSEQDLSDQYVPRAAHEDLEGRVDKRLKKALKGRYNVEELLGDAGADVLQELADRGADKLKKLMKIEGDGGVTEEDYERIRTQVREQEVAPLTDQLTASATEIDTLRGDSLHRAVLEAAGDAGVKESLRGFLVDRYRGMAAWHPEHRGFFIKGVREGEFQFSSTTAENGKPPFMGIAEHLIGKRDKGEWGDLFDAKRRDGSGGGGTGDERQRQPGGDFGHVEFKSDFKTDQERSDFITKKGLAAFEKLPVTRPKEVTA